MLSSTAPIKKLLFFSAILISFNSFGQKEARLYAKAEESFQAMKYFEALKSYKEISSIDSKYLDVEYKLEICSLLSSPGDNKPLETFFKLGETYAQEDDHYYYWLGKIYTHRYMIDEAMDAFEKFQQQVTYSGSEDVAFTKNLIEQSEILKEYFYNPGNYEIHQLEAPVNSTGAELSPVYFEEGNELLFASNRSGNGDDSFKIFYTKSSPTGWAPLKEVTSLGTFARNNANIEVVNEDGKLFIFREENGGDLYYSQASGDTWTLPVEFDSRVSNNHLHSHFFINEHEDRIVFASDENANGLDIFESFRDPENGKWSKPKPFHSAINSSFNDDSPYLSPDESKLYFCSDRPGGLGGYDIYVSTFDEATFSWSEPENLGWPINSPDNEFHFKMNPNQSSGYFVSDRLHTMGDYDIYFFWEVQQVKIEGRIFDETVNGPLTNAEIRFHPSQYLDEYFRSEIDATGRYSTKIISDEVFEVEIISQGNIVHTERFEIHASGGEATTHLKDFSVH